MKKLFVLGLLALIPFITDIKTAEADTTYATVYTAVEEPMFIMAPSIALFSPIQGMGINNKGELDVPSGSTNNVGWYAGGARPGDAGTAVLDAHVFAAFKDLDKVKPGEYIYIWMSSGRLLTFEVKGSSLYDLSALSPVTLFDPLNTSPKLNLITCAGQFLGSTYSHRLIVSAELV